MFSALSRFGRAGAPAGRSLDAAVRALFPDVWYDPSDTATLFQDAAGTTPVTAVEQAVGLMLDKSRGLVLGSELVTNGTFDANISGWSGGIDAAAVTFSWDGSGRMKGVRNFGGGSYTQAETTVVGKWYKVSVVLSAGTGGAGLYIQNSASAYGPYLLVISKAAGASGEVSGYFVATAATTYVHCYVGNTAGNECYFDNISIRELPGNHAYHTPGDTTTRPVLSARVNSLVGTATLATQSITTLATNYRLTFGGTGSVALSGTATGTYSAGTHTVTCTAGTLTLTVTGSVTNADLRPSDLAAISTYQRVTTSTDYDVSAGVYYLRCDGVNDSLQTNAIDFSGTDKMFVSAGVRKLSDAAGAIFVELSSSFANAGSFGVFAPNTATVGDYGFGSRGTSAAAALKTGYAAPITNVLSGTGDISGDSAILRVNGGQVAINTNDQGTGNYGNYPLYLFRRGGSSLPFNGWFYGAVIKGATLTAAQIAIVEQYLATKTKTVVLA